MLAGMTNNMSNAKPRSSGSRVRAAIGAAIVGVAAFLVPLGAGAAHASPIDDMQAKAKALQDQIDQNGDKIGALAEQYNGAQFKLQTAQQAVIDAVNPPNLAVVFTDTGGATVRVTQATILSNQQNGWARPASKPIVIFTDATHMAVNDCTQTFLQTMQIKAGQITTVDTSKLQTVVFEFTVPATASEIWLDNVEFVIN